MTKEQIKWGCVQPLTGGMYLGAEKAIGHPAEWIISYPGLTNIIYDKENKPIDAANERNIVNYLTKKNRMPDYYTMNRTMTQNDDDLNPILTNVRFDGQDPKNAPEGLYEDLDIVVGVPVCAGLSMASVASQDRKDECNCQMVWMEKYVLNTIKPKVYIFENAPTLMSGRGDEMREKLEEIAKEAGYSTVYYKTDTKLHHNCQKRPRTFIFFFNNRDGKTFIPSLNYEKDNLSVEDFFAEMGVLREDDPMNVSLQNVNNVEIPIEYAKYVFGEDWRGKVEGHDMTDRMSRNKEERARFMKWLRENYDEKYVKWYNRFFGHVDEKAAENKGWWSVASKYFDNDCLPACMYKNVPIVIHHKENRLYTMREWLFAMGHPTDFDMVGEPKNFNCRMGQNVPANTAKWVVGEALRIVINWTKEPNNTVTDLFNAPVDVAYYDNTKQRRIY